MLVLLTSAGIGSRLKPYTNYINKGLLPYKNKPAILNNGLNIQVPPFIESGDEVIIDSRNLEYIKKI